MCRFLFLAMTTLSIIRSSVESFAPIQRMPNAVRSFQPYPNSPLVVVKSTSQPSQQGDPTTASSSSSSSAVDSSNGTTESSFSTTPTNEKVDSDASSVLETTSDTTGSSSFSATSSDEKVKSSADRKVKSSVSSVLAAEDTTNAGASQPPTPTETAKSSTTTAEDIPMTTSTSSYTKAATAPEDPAEKMNAQSTTTKATTETASSSSSSSSSSPVDDIRSKLIGVTDNKDQIFANVFGGSFGERGEVYVATQAFLVLCIVLGGLPLLGSVLNLLCGPLLMAVGAIVIVLGIVDLGAALSPWPTTSGQDLITTGIYAKLRHPIYAGLLALMAGFSVATESAPRLLLTAALWYSLELKSDYEEEQLLEDYASEYEDYQREVPGKFFPDEIVAILPWTSNKDDNDNDDF